MANFAVIKDGIVLNVIVAESKEIAEQVSTLECIEFTEEQNVGIGSTYADGIFS
jgi:hypothetical protein